MVLAGPRACWRWQGPRLSVRPVEQQQQVVELFAALHRRLPRQARLTGLVAGVELGDGRRRRLRVDASDGLSSGALAELVRDWADGSRGGWIAGLAGWQAAGQWLGLDDLAGRGWQLAWLPAVAPDPLAPGSGPALLLRAADLQEHGHLDVELELRGALLLTGRAGQWNRPQLVRLIEQLGRGLPLLRTAGELAPPAVPVECWPLPPEHPAGGGPAELLLLREPGDPRLTVALVRTAPGLEEPGSLDPEQVRRIRDACLACGDALTTQVALRLPAGPFTLPPEAGERLRSRLDLRPAGQLP